MNKVVSFKPVFAFFKTYNNVHVTVWSAADSGVALTGKLNFSAFGNSLRDFYRKCLRTSFRSNAESFFTSCHSFLRGYMHLCFDIIAAVPVLPAGITCFKSAHAPEKFINIYPPVTEKHVKKVTESAVTCSILIMPKLGRIKIHTVSEIYPEPIILFSFFRISQNLVSFVNLLKLFFGFFVSGVRVGMIFFCKFTKALFYFILGCVLTNTKDFVVVPVLHLSPSIDFDFL